MFTVATVLNALELGFIYALVALALFLSFRVLNIADMTTDGAFTLGCAVSATAAVAGHPFLGLPLALLAGAAAGFVTAFLQTRLAVPSILAGIITNTGLYTVNLAVMGFSSNVPMLKTTTIFTVAQSILGENAPYKLLVAALVTVVVCVLLILFLGTRMGLSIRATGDNPDMVRASSINTAFTITVGLCISNAMTALSGAVLAQYQRSADINLGTGMVVIGLASLIIGETLFGRSGMWVKAVAGCRYRQRYLPFHHCAGPACQRPVRVSETDFRRHRGAGHRCARHPVQGGFPPPPCQRRERRCPPCLN